MEMEFMHSTLDTRGLDFRFPSLPSPQYHVRSIRQQRKSGVRKRLTEGLLKEAILSVADLRIPPG